MPIRHRIHRPQQEHYSSVEDRRFIRSFADELGKSVWRESSSIPDHHHHPLLSSLLFFLCPVGILFDRNNGDHLTAPKNPMKEAVFIATAATVAVSVSFIDLSKMWHSVRPAQTLSFLPLVGRSVGRESIRKRHDSHFANRTRRTDCFSRHRRVRAMTASACACVRRTVTVWRCCSRDEKVNVVKAYDDVLF